MSRGLWVAICGFVGVWLCWFVGGVGLVGWGVGEFVGLWVVGLRANFAKIIPLRYLWVRVHGLLW